MNFHLQILEVIQLLPDGGLVPCCTVIVHMPHFVALWEKSYSTSGADKFRCSHGRRSCGCWCCRHCWSRRLGRSKGQRLGHDNICDSGEEDVVEEVYGGKQGAEDVSQAESNDDSVENCSNEGHDENLADLTKEVGMVKFIGVKDNGRNKDMLDNRVWKVDWLEKTLTSGDDVNSS